MNRLQKFILLIYAAMIIILCIFFVPYEYIHPLTGKLIKTSGYSSIWYPPGEQYFRSVLLASRIDMSRLIVELIALTILAGIMYFITTEIKDSKEIKVLKSLKSKVSIIIISFLLFISVLYYSFPYFRDIYFSTIKGDYKIFCLGDIKSYTNEKIKFLKRKREISGNWVSNLDEKHYYSFGFKSKFLNDDINCFLGFENKKLNQIYITFDMTAVEILEKYGFNDEKPVINYIDDSLKPVLCKIYGDPINFNFSQKHLTEENITGYQWDLKDKSIELLANKNYPSIRIEKKRKMQRAIDNINEAKKEFGK